MKVYKKPYQYEYKLSASASTTYVNVFNMADFIIEYYKMIGLPIYKKRLYLLIFLYQYYVSLCIYFQYVDDEFYIRDKGRSEEMIVPKDIENKYKRFDEYTNLADVNKPIRAFASLQRSNGKYGIIEHRVIYIANFINNFSIDDIMNGIKQNPVYIKRTQKKDSFFSNIGFTAKEKKRLKARRGMSINEYLAKVISPLMR